MNRRVFLKYFGIPPLAATTSVIPSGAVEAFEAFEKDYHAALPAPLSFYVGGVTWVGEWKADTKEAAVLYRRARSAALEETAFLSDACAAFIRLFPGIGTTSADWYVVWGVEQISTKAEERGVPLKPGAQPCYVWARITTFVPVAQKIPECCLRSVSGLLQPIWI